MQISSLGGGGGCGPDPARCDVDDLAALRHVDLADGDRIGARPDTSRA